MITQVVIIRHGLSEKDKMDPKRGITNLGKNQIKSTGQFLKSLTKGKSVVIITSDVPRAQQSAGVLSRELAADVKTFSNMRVDNLDFLSKDQDKLFNLYFRLFDRGKLPKVVISPNQVAKRFLDIIASAGDYEIAVIVGHSVALEAFANYQEIFLPKKTLKELGYAEFAVLEKVNHG